MRNKNGMEKEISITIHKNKSVAYMFKKKNYDNENKNSVG